MAQVVPTFLKVVISILDLMVPDFRMKGLSHPDSYMFRITKRPERIFMCCFMFGGSHPKKLGACFFPDRQMNGMWFMTSDHKKGCAEYLSV